jgi:dTDP-glucose pyrophosphorylase
MKNYKAHVIRSQSSILSALDILNNLGQTLTLFVLDQNDCMIGTLTDGDVRRGFLKGLALDAQVDDFMSKKFHFLNNHEISVHELKRIKNLGIQLLPVLDESGKIIKVIDFNKIQTILPVDAVIMAGGKGERMRPFTEKVPKPLLMLGQKSIIEHMIDHSIYFGIENFHITTRYLADQLVDKLGNGSEKGIKINFIKETEPLGTIGSVRSIKNFKNDTILVMNSDLLTNIDLEEFYLHYQDTRADMAIASVSQDISLSYAVIRANEDEILTLDEKPTYTYDINAGIYLIKKELLKLIPPNKAYNATDLIYALLQKGKKIVKFPLIGYWIDIGKPEDYRRAQELIRFVKHTT